MSLEQALKENTEALNRFTALLENMQSVNMAVVNSRDTKTVEKQPEAEITHVAEQNEHQSLQARDELQDAEATDGYAALNESAQQAFTADDVKSALMQVAKKSRSELQKILAHFNVANVSAIQAKDYAAVVVAAEKALESANA